MRPSEQSPERPADTEPLTDGELAQRAAEGDEDAWRELFERHAATLRAYAARRLPAGLRRRVSAADVVQEAWIVALERCATFEDRPDTEFRKWMIGIVERKVREAVRRHAYTSKRAVGREVTRGLRPETGQLPARSASPSEVAIGAEAGRLAQRVLATLPDPYREVLQLTRGDQRSLEQAAEALGRSREATRRLLERALQRFGQDFDRLRGTGRG